MKYNLSLKSDIFAEAVENFDVKLRDTLAKLLKQRDADASVTLKVSFYLTSQKECDEDGVEREVVRPVFDCTSTSTIAQKSKISTPIERELKLRIIDGQMELRDLDENTLFDMEANHNEHDADGR